MKKLTALILAAFAAFTLTACGGGERQTLKIGVMSDFDSIPFFVMKQQIKPENIELVLFRSPAERDSALNAGELDGTISDALAVYLAQSKNFDIKITSMTNGAYGVVSKDALSSPKELEGKEVALSLNTVIEFVLDSLVTQAGGDPDKVIKQAVPQMPSRLELLKNGQIDAIAVPEPYVTASEEYGTVAGRSNGINPGVFVFTQKAIDEKKSLIKTLYKHYDEAVKLVNDGIDLAPVIDEMGLPATALKAAFPTYEKHRLPDDAQIAAAKLWLINKGLLENKDYTVVYDIG